MAEVLTKPAAETRPAWLRARLPSGDTFERTKEILDGLRLVTVCREALCPNVSECWGHGTATIMVLGDTCTRGCRFCAVNTGNPGGKVDPTEPERVAEGVSAMGMKYIVLTSVDRDDLPDGGAGHFAECVRAIKRRAPGVKVETLIPDFRGDERALDVLCASEPDVVAQNLETVERLTHYARDRRAGYQQTLSVLKYVKIARPHNYTKSSIMLGLGETDEEIEQSMKDLRNVDVDILTLGQYLQPTKKHLPVSRYVTPEEFMAYGQMARSLGFKAVASAPFVRSSYRADALI